MKKFIIVKKNSYTISYIMIWMLFFICFFHRHFIEIGVSDNIKYSLDLINIFLFSYSFFKKPKNDYTDKILLLCYLGIICIGSISALANIKIWKSGLIYYLFDCRNLLRYLMFFRSCKTLLTHYEINKICNWCLFFHVINSIFIVYQYFTLEVRIYWTRGDYLNGFFGTSVGGNIYVNVLLISTAIIILYRWTNKKCGLKLMLFIMSLNLIIATLIELKAYFIEIILICIIFVYPYIKRPLKKYIVWELVFILGGAAALISLIEVLYNIYPWMDGTISLNYIVKAFSIEQGSGISRLTAIPDVITKIFKGNIFDSLFGVGLGVANANGLKTLFSQQFYNMSYTLYSTAYVLVETGLIGLALYIFSFVALFSLCPKKTMYASASKCMCIMAIFLIIYDEALKIEIGYMVFFLIAICFNSNKGMRGKQWD